MPRIRSLPYFWGLGRQKGELKKIIFHDSPTGVGGKTLKISFPKFSLINFCITFSEKSLYKTDE